MKSKYTLNLFFLFWHLYLYRCYYSFFNISVRFVVGWFCNFSTCVVLLMFNLCSVLYRCSFVFPLYCMVIVVLFRRCVCIVMLTFYRCFCNTVVLFRRCVCIVVMLTSYRCSCNTVVLFRRCDALLLCWRPIVVPVIQLICSAGVMHCYVDVLSFFL
jgi:hypothetical protein